MSINPTRNESMRFRNAMLSHPTRRCNVTWWDGTGEEHHLINVPFQVDAQGDPQVILPHAIVATRIKTELVFEE